MSDAQPWTIQRLLTWTADYFKRHDSDSPRLDAEVLLSAALGCQRIELYTRFDQVPPPAPLEKFRAWVKRRAAGEPVAYLVGQKEFFSLPLAVDSSVLIPRPETELLVVELLDRARKLPSNQPINIADVGTGSGNIAIALARHLPNATIHAVDISPQSLAVAKANAQVLGVLDRIHCHVGDLLAPITDRGPFDFIASNPPYIGLSEKDSLPASVVNFEPATALFSGPNGTEIIERLTVEAASLLRPGGFLLFEISPRISDKVRALLASQSGWSSWLIKKDHALLDRIAIAQKTA